MLSTARIDRALTGSAPPFEIVMSALTESAALTNVAADRVLGRPGTRR